LQKTATEKLFKEVNKPKTMKKLDRIYTLMEEEDRAKFNQVMEILSKKAEEYKRVLAEKKAQEKEPDEELKQTKEASQTDTKQSENMSDEK